MSLQRPGAEVFVEDEGELVLKSSNCINHNTYYGAGGITIRERNIVFFLSFP